MSDLLHYSLLYCPRRNHNAGPVELAPILSLKKMSICARDIHGCPRVVLPLLHDFTGPDSWDGRNFSNYDISKVQNSVTPLTERNLYTLMASQDRLGLLGSTVASKANLGSGLSGLVLGHSSLLLSPSLSFLDAQSNTQLNTTVASIKQDPSMDLSPRPKISLEIGLTKEREEIEKRKVSKRRQRLGPSCDTCRSRKVKCDAILETLENDVRIISETILQSRYGISQSQTKESSVIPISGVGFVYVLSNHKLMKMSDCKSCIAKHQNCTFSQGFFRHDITRGCGRKPGTSHRVQKRLHAKTVTDMTPLTASKALANTGPDTQLYGQSSRKTLCNWCRQRKVRCVMAETGNTCLECTKRNHVCKFEILH